jgi:hypothetical protein
MTPDEMIALKLECVGMAVETGTDDWLIVANEMLAFILQPHPLDLYSEG